MPDVLFRAPEGEVGSSLDCLWLIACSAKTKKINKKNNNNDKKKLQKYFFYKALVSEPREACCSKCTKQHYRLNEHGSAVGSQSASL